MSHDSARLNIRTGSWAFLLLPILIAAGLAGNHFPFSLLNAHFIFGSIFAMLTLQIFGWGRGVIAAAVISAYTYFSWNHPWAFVTMTAEAAVVGWFFTRRRVSLIVADTLYWIILGIPLGYFCFHTLSGFPVDNSLFLLTKQAFNGIANALAARLIYTLFSRPLQAERISLRETLANFLVLFVLLATITLVINDSRRDLAATNRNIRQIVTQNSRFMADSLQDYLTHKEAAVAHLAHLAATLNPSEMQARLEQANASGPDFVRMCLLDRAGSTVAYSPTVDELGQSTIGKSIADRSYLPLLRQTLKPMLSEVMPSRFSRTGSVVILLAPVIADGAYKGAIGGIVDFEQIRSILENLSLGGQFMYTLVDKNENVILTNRSDQQIMKPFSREGGGFEPLTGLHRKSLVPVTRSMGSLSDADMEIRQWIPQLSPGASTIDLWGKSLYVVESAVGKLSEWRLIVEQPVAPFQKRLYDEYSEKYFLLFTILLVTLAVAAWLSRRTLVGIEQLGLATRELPARISAGEAVTWPESRILETHSLIANVRETADSLRDKFTEIRDINASLEQRVAEKTGALRQSEASIKHILENIPAMIFMKEAATLRYVLLNQAGEELLGRNRDELLGKNDYDLFPREEADFFAEKDREALSGRLVIDIPEEPIQTRQGRRILHTRKIPLYDVEGQPQSLLGVSIDITASKQSYDALQEANRKLRASQTAVLDIMEDLKTEIEARKQSEAEISQLNTELEQRVFERTAQLEATNEELEAFSYSVSHDLRAPLRHINGYVDLLNKRFLEALPDKAGHYLHEITDSAKQMGILIDDLLQFSKTGRQELRQENMNMNAAVQEALEKLKVDTKNRKITWSVAELPWVYGDYSLLKQVWTNLLDNAVKYTRYKDEAEIEVGFTREPDHWVFFLRDNGVGFDMQYAHKLFGVFQRLHPPAQFEGTGIGLANVQRIIHKHGGRVRAEGRTDEGAAFYFTIPEKPFSEGDPL